MRTNSETVSLDREGLRRFGLTVSALIAAIFGLVLPIAIGFAWPVWPWVVAGCLTLWSITAPDSLRTLYRIWMAFGVHMSRITTPIVMGTLFFSVFTPVALLFRVLRRDALSRGFDPRVESYRKERDSDEEDSLERPF
ncbi:MAG: SxtJ family membrane protein [Pseudomonadota bacterium]